MTAVTLTPSIADWELGADEFIADESEDIEDYVYHKPSRPAPPPPIYSLGSMTYDEAAEGGSEGLENSLISD